MASKMRWSTDTGEADTVCPQFLECCGGYFCNICIKIVVTYLKAYSPSLRQDDHGFEWVQLHREFIRESWAQLHAALFMGALVPGHRLFS